jgi:hypothetical protein
MRVRHVLLLPALLAAAGCARSTLPPLVCVPATQAPYAASGGWYCQEVAVSVREPAAPVEHRRTGQYADLVVIGVGRCPDAPGPFAPAVLVKNAGPVPAGAFNVAVDVGVFDAGGAPAVTTAAVARVPGLAAGAETTVPLERMPPLTLRAGDRVTITAIADPQQTPVTAPNVFGEIMELDEGNNSALQNCTVPGR